MINSENLNPKPQTERNHLIKDSKQVSYFESFVSAVSLCGSVIKFRDHHYRLEQVFGTTVYGARMLDLTLVNVTSGKTIDPVIPADKIYSTADQLEQAMYRRD